MRARSGGRRWSVILGLGAVLLAALAVADSASAQGDTCFGRDVTIVALPGQITFGTAGDDVIVGTSGDDDIRAGDGDDRICSKQGDDVVKGGPGDDRITLGKGDDVAAGGKGNDLIKGKSGSDRIEGNTGEDEIHGGSGADHIKGGQDDDMLFGKSGNDNLAGNSGNDEIDAGSGDDSAEGGKNDDIIWGKGGADEIRGNSGADQIFGGTGYDDCWGGRDVDELSSCNEPPNILLLIADDFGVESSVCYSDTPSPAPRLESICSEAVVFENVWSSPVCSPTRAGILTGRHSFRTGIGEQTNGANGLEIDSGEWTLPRVLDAATSGYSHASFGKWHLGGDGDNPNTMGWGHFSGLLTGALGDYEDWTKTTDGVATHVTTYATTEIVNDTLGWIGTQDSPWLAWVAFNAPHTPFHLPPAELHTQTVSGTDADIAANPEAYYDAAIEALDTEIGRLLDSIAPEELANTTIIFIGDNGNPNRVSSHASGRAKGTLHEGGLHVPMMIWGEDVTAAGTTTAALAGTVDLYATVLGLAGVDISSVVPDSVAVDSNSLVSILDGSATAGGGGSDLLLAELFGSGVNLNRAGQAIRNAQYKLIDFSNGGLEFYDLLADPLGDTPIAVLSAAEQAQSDDLAAELASWTAAES